MVDIKSTRPSRDALGEALEMADKAEYHPDVARMLAREVRALQHGMEEMANEWRQVVADADRFNLHVQPLSYERAADELDKLRSGS